jgi:hypothetical protein
MHVKEYGPTWQNKALEKLLGRCHFGRPGQKTVLVDMVLAHEVSEAFVAITKQLCGAFVAPKASRALLLSKTGLSRLLLHAKLAPHGSDAYGLKIQK